MKRLLSLFLVGALVIFAPISLANAAGIQSATGGTITTVGSDKVHTFTADGTFTPTGSGNVKILLIGGGGGGAASNPPTGNTGGGGGGGGVYEASVAVTNGTGYTIDIGTGGAGGTYRAEGSKGANSTGLSLTAYGGGGGTCTTGANHDGGCGGGGSSASTAGGAGSQGGAGGTASGADGAGGGGIGAAGSGINGGNGTTYTIYDDSSDYYGGGGASSVNVGAAGTGGLGGGANGVLSYNPGNPGTDGLGGGGSCGVNGSGGSDNNGGKGGDGVVIIRYTPTPAAPTNVAATDGTYTDKVTVTWTKSSGATNYKVYEGSNLLDTVGDVATYDDSAAGAPTITPGTTVATDGTSTANVGLSLSGTSTSNGASRTYKVVAVGAGGDSADSSTDTGYRGVGSLTYQWQMSAADSDASYSNLGGATSSTYNATEAPAGVITPGTAAATDGTSTLYVTLSLSGQSVADGAGRYFKCTLNATGASQQVSTANRGYRTTGALTYQWQRSAADSDASYSNIGSATTTPYNDTGAPPGEEGRYYKCVEDATGTTQQTSTVDRGYRMVGGYQIIIVQ